MGRIGDLIRAAVGREPAEKAENQGELGDRAVDTSTEGSQPLAKDATMRAASESPVEEGTRLRDRAKEKLTEIKDRTLNKIDHRLDRKVIDEKIELIGADDDLDKKSAKDYRLQDRLDTLKEILGEDSKATSDQKIRACKALQGFIEEMPYDHKEADDVKDILGQVFMLFYQADQSLEQSDPGVYNAMFQLNQSVSIYLPSRWD